MRSVRSVGELRAALREPRQAGRVIGLVTTMGAFHAGHLSLMERARRECEEVVVSLFVNPRQFDRPDDLASYPRNETADAALAAEAGVDLLFAPPPEEVYPQGFATTVSVQGLRERLEGEHRGAGHFDGVATVVTKLLNMVSPDVAYFGEKDAQQVALIRRLVRDLDMPVRIEVCPTVREDDGLALSSRNVHLHGDERARAAALHAALLSVADQVRSGQRDPARATAEARSLLHRAGVRLEYLVLASEESLIPVSVLDGPVRALIAAHVGSTRLIDNLLIDPSAAGGAAGRA